MRTSYTSSFQLLFFFAHLFVCASKTALQRRLDAQQQQHHTTNWKMFVFPSESRVVLAPTISRKQNKNFECGPTRVCRLKYSMFVCDVLLFWWYYVLVRNFWSFLLPFQRYLFIGLVKEIYHLPPPFISFSLVFSRFSHPHACMERYLLLCMIAGM